MLGHARNEHRASRVHRNFAALEAHDSGAREHVIDLGRRVPVQPEPVARPEFGHAASHPGGLGQPLREQGAPAKPPAHRVVPPVLRRVRLVDARPARLSSEFDSRRLRGPTAIARTLSDRSTTSCSDRSAGQSRHARPSSEARDARRPDLLRTAASKDRHRIRAGRSVNFGRNQGWPMLGRCTRDLGRGHASKPEDLVIHRRFAMFVAAYAVSGGPPATVSEASVRATRSGCAESEVIRVDDPGERPRRDEGLVSRCVVEESRSRARGESPSRIR